MRPVARLCRGPKAGPLLLCAVLLARPALAQTTILFEGFEGNFPGDNGWSVGNDNPIGPPAYWKDVDFSFGGQGTHSGSWKGYCAGIGYGGSTTSPTYQNNMTSYMSRAIDLTAYTAASLTFWHKIPSIETCCDICRVYMDGALLWSQNLPVSAWTQVNLSLNAYVGGTHTLRFEFYSDSSVVYEGWYLDDITVSGTPIQPPYIFVQPLSQSAEQCQTVTFSVMAQGTPPFTYQWRFNGTNISGAAGASSSYTVNRVQASDAGSYSVVVSNAGGSAPPSTDAILTVTGVGGFTDCFDLRGMLNGYTNFVTGDSSNYTHEAGEPNHAGASGTRSAWLAWTAPASGICTMDTFGSGFDTVLAVYTGTNLASLVPVATNDDAAGTLQSQVTFNSVSNTMYQIAVDGYAANVGGSIVFHQSLAAPPIITAQPQGATNEACQYVLLSAAANGAAPLSYQWRLNGSPITNAAAMNPYYILLSPQPSDSGNYDLVATDPYGSATSQVAVVTVLDTTAPVLSVPSNIETACVGPGGAPVTFSVTATDCDPNPIVTCTAASGSIFPIGYTTVYCTATDHSSNQTARAAFTIHVFGSCDAGCIAINCPSGIQVDLGSAPTIAVDYGVTATNTCSGQPVPVTCTPPSGSQFPPGTNLVTCVASGGGASEACAFNVIVRAPPPVVKVPPSLTVQPTFMNSLGQIGANVFFQAQSLDNSGSNGIVSINPPPGSFFPVGTTLITCVGGGIFGNQTTQTFNITVNGPGPFFSNPDLAPDDWDFEQPDLAAWKLTGDFPLSWQPIIGDLLTVKRIPDAQQQLANNIGGDYWRDLSYPVGQRGQQWFSTAVFPEAAPGGWTDDQFSEAWVGTALSKSFVIQHKVISFLIGGTQDGSNERIELLIQGQTNCPDTVQIDGQTYTICAYATGHGREVMRREFFDVTPYLGRTARIRIVDNSANGHLNVDDFRFKDVAPADENVTIGGRTYPSVVSFAGYLYDWDSPVWGFTDMHTHPMSYIGFGGKIMHGSPDGGMGDPLNPAAGLTDCKADHGGWGLDNLQGNYWRQIMMIALDDAGPDPHREGYNADEWLQFRNWPVFTTIAHQQMWYDWIKRSYNGGQRVMVALCVNSRLLAVLSKGPNPVDDKTIADWQIAELKNFVARHNDFMEIAYDPFQLRDIVRRDKLAIVIGTELDDIGNFARSFGVHTNADDTSKQLVQAEIHRLYTNGVRYVFPVHLVNNKFGGTAVAGLMLNVANKYLNGEGFQMQPADPGDDINFWLDNIDMSTLVGLQNLPPAINDIILAAGAAFGAPLVPLVVPWIVSAGNALTPLAPGASAAAGGIEPLALMGAAGLLPPLLTLIAADQGDVVVAIIPLPGNYPIYPTAQDTPNGSRNQLGLTPLGQYAVTEMMKLGMMIDVDHMSQNTLDGVLSIATNVPGGYPLNSGHNGLRELGLHARPENSRSPGQIEVISTLGGLMGVGWENAKDGSFSQTNDFNPQVSVSKIPNDCAGTCKTFAQTYLLALERLHGRNVAIGTDMDGFVVAPGPRFGPQSAFGLGSTGPDILLRPGQVAAQINGILYTPTFGRPITDAAFRGRAEDAGNNDQPARADLGFAYNADQADFFAAMRIFYWYKTDVQNGVLSQNDVLNRLASIQNGLSDNYPEDGFANDGSKRRISDYALGLLNGIQNWPSGWDLRVGDVQARQDLGKAVYRFKKVPSEPPPQIISNNNAINDRYNRLLRVWDDYQKIFGRNTPMTRCVTASTAKEWDLNFHGVAHYGLLPDFFQDLSNVGIDPHDLSVLFHSAEHFARMWTRSIDASYGFVPRFTGTKLAPGGGALQLSFTGAENYTLEETPNLINPNWQPANVITISSNAVTRTVQVPNPGQSRFYRLRGN